jgi:hypothetical protein
MTGARGGRLLNWRRRGTTTSFPAVCGGSLCVGSVPQNRSTTAAAWEENLQRSGECEIRSRFDPHAFSELARHTTVLRHA